MSSFNTPNSRPYVHQSCGSTTIVSDEHFAMICDPFRLVTGTFCVACEEHFPLTEFVWEDTGEVIADARKRWAEEAPPAVRTLNSGLGCWLAFALGGAAGAAIGWAVGNGVGWKIGVGAGIGAVVVAIGWAGILVPMITKNVYNWDPRLLK